MRYVIDELESKLEVLSIDRSNLIARVRAAEESVATAKLRLEEKEYQIKQVQEALEALL
jgi:outer membrane murein-binding lipoprotein Lpp